MNRKKVEIRRKVREEQVQHLRNKVREDLIDSISKQRRAQQDIESVLQCIHHRNIAALFDLCIASQWENLRSLSPEAARQSFNFLSLDLQHHKAAIISQQLIKMHWDSLFEARSQGNHCSRQFLECVCRRIDQLVGEMESGKIDENGAASLGLNAHLAIVRQFCLRIVNAGCSRDSQLVNIQQYIQYQLHRWLPFLLSNKIFMSSVEKAVTCQTPFQPQLLAKFHSNLTLTATLLRNISHSLDNRTPALNILVTTITQHPLSQRFVSATTETYLQVVKHFLLEYQTKPRKQLYQYLFKAFQGLVLLLESAAVGGWDLPGVEQLDRGFFGKLFGLLRAEACLSRLTLYRLIEASLQILDNHQINILPFLDINHYQVIAKEIRQQVSPDILAAAIRLLLKLLRSLQLAHPHSYTQILEFLQEREVALALETLQYHPNREVALFAEELIENEFREQAYPQDFHYHQNESVL